MSLLSSKKAIVTASVAVAGVVFAAPSATEASFGERTLHFGMNNNDVKVLQETLKEKGFFQFHTATGFYGEVTRKAVTDFQKANGLTADGIAGPQTFGALKSNSSSNGSSQPARQEASKTIPDTQLLRQGSSGSAVTLLQEKLKELGYYTGSVSGSFQAGTREAVLAYQQANSLHRDGIAGPQTIGHMNSGKGKAYSPEQPSSSNGSKNSGSLPANTVLRLNDKGSAVSELQEKLKTHGFYNSGVTGTYGTITRQAVRDFQQAAGIGVDGIAGPQTFRALENWTGQSQNGNSGNNNSNSGSNNSSSASTLREGVEGTAVTELQNQLRTLGLFHVQPTGYYGSITKESVRKFQQQWNLTADGIATKATIQKLNEVAEIHRKSAENSSSQPSRGSFQVLNLIADASTFLGTPYVWGGASPTGFDCSGFIQYVFKQNGLTVPRTAAQQYNFGKNVSKPQVGDIVFFETYTSGPSHNGIYIGNNQFIHSGSSTGITIANLNTSYWSQRYLGAKRLH
ncbi:peptidoglycan-binding protein [Bacillus sp. H-16]|uniref:C40 family peptidase n=1 Tax=Alteribacter salitolerans TaxID=2912333 RepID=UPI00196606B1|nr:peptidoglycan-binding protein [Alteribacter salitolerans]MBM7095623.1 peptidoglycan-binding protein [Alteribacter salitolerans]